MGGSKENLLDGEAGHEVLSESILILEEKKEE